MGDTIGNHLEHGPFWEGGDIHKESLKRNLTEQENKMKTNLGLNEAVKFLEELLQMNDDDLEFKIKELGIFRQLLDLEDVSYAFEEEPLASSLSDYIIKLASQILDEYEIERVDVVHTHPKLILSSKNKNNSQKSSNSIE